MGFEGFYYYLFFLSKVVHLVVSVFWSLFLMMSLFVWSLCIAMYSVLIWNEICWGFPIFLYSCLPLIFIFDTNLLNKSCIHCNIKRKPPWTNLLLSQYEKGPSTKPYSWSWLPFILLFLLSLLIC